MMKVSESLSSITREKKSTLNSLVDIEVENRNVKTM